MNLNQLNYFIHVAEHGSFSKAALVLGVAQPALSRQVRALEAELRETLLLRNGRGVALTDAGQRLLEHGQGILRSVAQARADLTAERDEPVGRIIVAMPPTQARLHTLALVQAFRARMPRARLAVAEGFSMHITEWLLCGRADLALVYDPEPLQALEIVPMVRERLCLVSLRNAAPRRPVSLLELSRYPLVMPQRGHIFRKRLETAAAMAGVQLHVACEISSVPAILELVAAGVGHAALGEQALSPFKHQGDLVLTRFRDADIDTTLCLVTPALKRSTLLIQRTAALLAELVRGREVVAAA